MSYQITPVEWLRAILADAEAHGMAVSDIIRVVQRARTMREADEAVNMLATAMQGNDG